MLTDIYFHYLLIDNYCKIPFILRMALLDPYDLLVVTILFFNTMLCINKTENVTINKTYLNI